MWRTPIHPMIYTQDPRPRIPQRCEAAIRDTMAHSRGLLMQFLYDQPRPKVLRTRLYGDQEFSRFELELLHTPILQRLYNLKQLRFADRVYPDAIHSRFNHVIGATQIVEIMAHRLL